MINNYLKKFFVVSAGLLASICISVIVKNDVKAAETTTIKSGNYEYQVFDESNKTASLRKIYNYGDEVVLPSMVDGYKIISVGVRSEDQINTSPNVGGVDYNKASIFAEEDSIVKKIVIPDGIGIIFPNAMHKMKSLAELQLPESLREIQGGNFMDAINLKKLSLPKDIIIRGNLSFLNVTFDELVVNGSLYGYLEDEGGMKGKINKLILNHCEESENIVSVNSVSVDKLIVDKKCESIYIQTGDFEEVVLKNPKTKLKYEYNDSSVKKVMADISNVTVKKKGKKYIYSWKPLKIYMSYWTVEKVGEKDLRSKIIYKVQKKNKANKYKNFKTINKAKISFDARTKIKVKALLINNRNKNQ